jgi:hypothetical protein
MYSYICLSMQEITRWKRRGASWFTATGPLKKCRLCPPNVFLGILMPFGASAYRAAWHDVSTSWPSSKAYTKRGAAPPPPSLQLHCFSLNDIGKICEKKIQVSIFSFYYSLTMQLQVALRNLFCFLCYHKINPFKPSLSVPLQFLPL